MNVPEGYSEEEVVNIISHISRKFARRFIFPPHTANDLFQQGWIFAMEGLRNYDGERPLYIFLHVHVRNQFHKFLRDNYYRNEPPCECPCKRLEKWKRTQYERRQLNSMTPLEHPNSILDSSQNPVVERAEVDEMFSLIDSKLPTNLRSAYRRMLDGVTIPKKKSAKLKEIIRGILVEAGYDDQER